MNTEEEDFLKMRRFDETIITPRLILMNNAPLEDFLGLTSSEMNTLLYEPFSADSPFRINKVSDETLSQIPFFMLTHRMLEMIANDTSVKLTINGCLPLSYCNKLYQYKYITEHIIEGGIGKLTREQNVPFIEVARIIAGLAKLTIKRKNRLYLTKLASQLLQANDRQKLFQIIFETYTTTYLWAYLDGYENELIGQLGFAFSISMLRHFGSTPHPASFYAEKYDKAFPLLQNQLADLPFFPKESQFLSCFTVRLFERFFEWFGLVEKIDKEAFPNGNNIYMKTTLVDTLYELPDLLIK